MSNGRDDIRVAIGARRHVKVRALVAALGRSAWGDLVTLWAYAAENHPSGVLPSPEIAEAAVEWDGTPGAFHAALVRLRLIESDGVTLHDWPEEQPYVYGRADRVEKARKAGIASAAARAGNFQRNPNGTFGKPNAELGEAELPVRSDRTPSASPPPPISSLPPNLRRAREGESHHPNGVRALPIDAIDTAKRKAALARLKLATGPTSAETIPVAARGDLPPSSAVSASGAS